MHPIFFVRGGVQNKKLKLFLVLITMEMHPKILKCVMNTYCSCAISVEPRIPRYAELLRKRRWNKRWLIISWLRIALSQSAWEHSKIMSKTKKENVKYMIVQGCVLSDKKIQKRIPLFSILQKHLWISVASTCKKTPYLCVKPTV